VSYLDGENFAWKFWDQTLAEEGHTSKAFSYLDYETFVLLLFLLFQQVQENLHNQIPTQSNFGG
jgi:hypothetical protein